MFEVSGKHAGCGGYFIHYVIREHHYNFLQCNGCFKYLGGEKTAKEVHRLMKIKVRPTIRRA